MSKLWVLGCLAVALLAGGPLAASASGPAEAAPEEGGLAGESAAPPWQEGGYLSADGADGEQVPGAESGDAVPGADAASSATASANAAPGEHQFGDSEWKPDAEGPASLVKYEADSLKEVGLGPWFALFAPRTVERAREAAFEVARADAALSTLLAAAVAVLAASSGTALVIAARTASGSSSARGSAKKTTVTKRRKLDAGI